MSLSGVYSKPFSLLSVCICDVCNRVEIMKHFPIQSAALFRSNNTRERETERMREEEEKAGRKGGGRRRRVFSRVLPRFEDHEERDSR